MPLASLRKWFTSQSIISLYQIYNEYIQMNVIIILLFTLLEIYKDRTSS